MTVNTMAAGALDHPEALDAVLDGWERWRAEWLGGTEADYQRKAAAR